jgi:hypothetical protein
MTRRILALALVFAMTAMLIPAELLAARAQVQGGGGQISGAAKDTAWRPLANHTVRLRSLDSGQEVLTTLTNSAGEFSFTGLNAGRYVVEVVGVKGEIVMASSPITLAQGAMRLAGLVLSPGAATGAAAAAAATGGSFFASTAGILLLAAAGAGVTAAVIAANDPASPSQ